MLPYVKRHKNRILAILAAGAAGGAAYYAYTRWLEDTEEESDAHVANRVLRSKMGAPICLASNNGIKNDTELQEENDEQVMAHFESVQRIATDATVPALMPRLRERLKDRTGVEVLVECLRVRKHPDTGAELTAQGKVELWNQLKLNSFTHAIASIWALPLLDLVLRVQLSIVGRFLYLEKAVPAGSSVSNSTDATSGLTASAQKAYLEHAGHLAASGIDALLARVRASLDKPLSEVALTKTCTLEDLLCIVSKTQQHFTDNCGPDLWAAILLPSVVAHAEDCGRATDLSEETGAIDADAMMVDDMLKEAKIVIGSVQFDSAVKASAALCSRRFVSLLQAALIRQQVSSAPLAKLVPLVREAGASLLDETTATSKQISEIPAARGLCASVYSSGPPL